MSALVLGVAHGHLGICSGRRPSASTSYTPAPAAASSLYMCTPTQQLSAKVRRTGAPERRSRVQLQPREKQKRNSAPLPNGALTPLCSKCSKINKKRHANNDDDASLQQRLTVAHFTPALLRAASVTTTSERYWKATLARQNLVRAQHAPWFHVTFQSSQSPSETTS